MVLVYYNVIFSHFTACNEWCYFITRRLYIFLSVYVYLYLPFKIAHREPYHSPSDRQTSPVATDYSFTAVQIRLLRPIRPPAVRHRKIAFAHKLIYRALDSGHATLVVSSYSFVRHTAELMPPLPVSKIAVNHNRLLRDLITVDHFELPHRHHHPFLVRWILPARIRFSQ